MTYDQALKRIENIVYELEQAEALSVSEYRAKAEEAKQLLDFCCSQLSDMEKQLLV